MPFEELEYVTKENAPPEASISYQPFLRKDKRQRPDAKPRLSISIPTTVCGVSKSKRFKLLMGSGDDLGKLLVRGVKDEDGAKGAVKPTEHEHFLKWNFGVVPKLGDEHFDSQKVPVRRVSDDSFEITIPKSWFEGGSGK